MLPDLTPFLDEVATAIRAELTPVLERLAAAEARLGVIGDLRDRVIGVEHKAAPVVELPNLTPLLERLAAHEARLTALGDVRDRLVVVETKAPPVVEPTNLTPVLERLATFEARLDGIGDIGLVKERLAAVEARAPIPGPPGKDGADGTNGARGADGKDGADGAGWDDLAAEHDGERTITLTAGKGDRVKTLGAFVFGVDLYRGVYVEGRTYVRGDSVTWAGSEWHCNETTTTKPGEAVKAWTLKVKRGRDGKDGRDAPTVPVVTVGRPA